jgi:hypothetical protein
MITAVAQWAEITSTASFNKNEELTNNNYNGYTEIYKINSAPYDRLISLTFQKYDGAMVWFTKVMDARVVDINGNTIARLRWA